MKKITIISLLLFITTTLFAQMQTVQLNNKKMQFNDGGELPAEKSFIISAEAAKAVTMIKLQVFSGNVQKNNPLYESNWKRRDELNNSTAILPNHYKLRSGKNYSFRFLYYRNIQENERNQIRALLNGTVKAFLKTSIQQKDDRYKFLNSPSDLFSSLNGILSDGLKNYERKTSSGTIAFSEITENILQSMTKTRLTGDSTEMASGNHLTLLLGQLDNEIEMIANSYQYVLEEEITLPDYPVEKKSNGLALNIGYAAVYNTGGFSDLDYFSGPYAGLSFPLGNRVFSGNFWNNLSLSAGIFLKDFTTVDSIKISGPVVNKPIYAALGYRLFDYLKFHAGATILEEKNSGISGGKSVYVKPFIGLSIELNMWLGIGKK